MTKVAAAREARARFGERACIFWHMKHEWIPCSAIRLGEETLAWVPHGERSPELVRTILRLAEPLERGVYVVTGDAEAVHVEELAPGETN